VAAEHEPRFDPLAGAQQLDLFDTFTTVFPRELFRCDACCLDHTRIDNELPRSGRSRRIDVCHGLRGCLHRGFTGTLPRTAS